MLEEPESSSGDPDSLEESLTPLDNLVCDECLEANLSSAVYIQSCVNCGENYCQHSASKIDPARCNECCSDVTVEITEIKKTQHVEDHSTGKVSSRSRKARRITISGAHWLFIQRSVLQMNDAEIEASIEYHRTFYDLLINERELARTRHFQRNAGKKIKITPAPGTTITTTTVEKKTKTLKPKAQPKSKTPDLATLLATLKAAGFTNEQIAAMAVGGKK